MTEDLICRQDTIRIAEQGQIQGYEWQFKELVKLPPVNPAEKVGQWLEDGDDYEYFWRCSKCSKRSDVRWRYCPYCGAKMQEVEE